MRNTIVIFLLIVFCISCNSKPLYFKKIITPEYEVRWYYYSYITSESPDYVEVFVDNQSTIVCESDNISDVNIINGDSLVIYFPGKPCLYDGDAIFDTNVSGLKIVVDTVVFNRVLHCDSL